MPMLMGTSRKVDFTVAIRMSRDQAWLRAGGVEMRAPVCTMQYEEERGLGWTSETGKVALVQMGSDNLGIRVALCL